MVVCPRPFCDGVHEKSVKGVFLFTKYFFIELFAHETLPQKNSISEERADSRSSYVGNIQRSEFHCCGRGRRMSEKEVTRRDEKEHENK